MDGTVAIFSKLLQDMPHASLRPDHRVPWNTESLRQSIRRLKANAMDVEGQAIGILPHSGNGFIAIGLVNADRSGGANAMRVQEDHDLANDFLGFPGLNHPLLAFGANTVKVGQPFGRLLNDIEHLCPKGLDQFLGKVRANAFDHPRAQIFLDAFEGAGWDDTQGLCFELQTMRPIIHPDALPLNVLARGDRRGCADNGDQVTVPTDFDAQDAEA